MMTLEPASAETMNVDPSTLLLHRDFLRRIALRLLGDDDLADEAVQRTWIASLERAPGQAGKVRSWLAAITRNEARQIARAESRRRHREEGSSRREAVPSAAEIAERERIRTEVIEALEDLPEAYRDALVLRYYEDLPPREIARRLGVPVETVRTRIKRGTEKMRRRLDRRHESREAWRSALLPIAIPYAVPRAGAVAAIAAALAAVGPFATWLGGLALALAALGGWWWFGNREGTPTSDPGNDAARTATAPIDPGGATGPRAANDTGGARGAGAVAADRDDADPAPASSTARGTTLAGRVVDGRTGRPLAGHEITVLGVRGETLAEIGPLMTLGPREDPPEPMAIHRAATVTDDEGRYRVDELPSGAFLVFAEARDGFPVRLAAFVFCGITEPLPAGFEEAMSAALSGLGIAPPTITRLDSGAAPRPIDLERTAGRRLRGRVARADGRPVAGAEVFGGPAMFLPGPEALDGPVRPPLARVVTDDDGGFVLPGALGSTHVVVTSPGFERSLRRVEVAPATPGATPAPSGAAQELATPIELIPRVPVTVRGRVVDPEGRAVESAVVRPGPGLRDASSAAVARTPATTDAATTGAATTGAATTDAAGRFELELTASASRREPATLIAAAEGFLETTAPLDAFERLRDTDELERAADSGRAIDVETEIVLRPFEGITVRILDADGRRVEHAWAQLDGLPVSGDATLRALYEPDREDLRIAAPPGERVLRAGASGFATIERRVEVPAGPAGPVDPIVVELAPIGWSFRVEVVGPDGAPAPLEIASEIGGEAIPVVAFHRFATDPTPLVRAGRIDDVLDGRHGSSIPPGMRRGSEPSTFRMTIDESYRGDRGWLVARVAGHPTLVHPFDRDTEMLRFEIDPAEIRRGVSIVSARPKLASRFTRATELSIELHDSEGRPAGAAPHVQATDTTRLVDRAGTYRLLLRSNLGVGVADVRVELGRDVAVEVEISEPAEIAGVARMPRGTRTTLTLVDSDRIVRGTTRTTDGRFAFAWLPAGDYRLIARAEPYVERDDPSARLDPATAAWATATVDLRLAVGESLEGLRLDLEPRRPVALRIATGLPVDAIERVTWRVLDRSGAVILHGHQAVGSPAWLQPGALPPGDYRLELLSPSRGTIVAPFSVPDEPSAAAAPDGSRERESSEPLVLTLEAR